MNQHDRDNLKFLMTSDPQTLREWFDTVSQDDIDYAWELLDAYKRELAVCESLLNFDDEFEHEVGAGQYPEAQAVLAKFRL